MPLVLELWWVPVRAPLPLNKCQNEDFSIMWKVVECCVIAHNASSICHITFWAGKATRIWMHILSVPFSFNLQQEFQKKKHSKQVSFRSKNIGYTPRCVHIIPPPVPHSLYSIFATCSASLQLYIHIGSVPMARDWQVNSLQTVSRAV